MKPPPKDGGWIRDLTEENVEPHPGPGASAAHKLCVITWNAQGHQNIFDALEACQFHGADALMLQEVNLGPEKRKDLIVAAARRGYHSYFTEASSGTDRVGRTLHRGGLAVLVKQELPSRQICCHRLPGTYETQCVRIGGVGCLVNCHLKPRAEWIKCKTHLEELQEAESRVFLGGDFNLLPPEVQVEGMDCIAAPQGADGSYRPTRVDGQRCIDFFLCKGMGSVAVSCIDETLSDHFPVRAELQVPGRPQERLQLLKPTTYYGLPQGATPPEFPHPRSSLFFGVTHECLYFLESQP